MNKILNLTETVFFEDKYGVIHDYLAEKAIFIAPHISDPDLIQESNDAYNRITEEYKDMLSGTTIDEEFFDTNPKLHFTYNEDFFEVYFLDPKEDGRIVYTIHIAPGQANVFDGE